MHALLVMRISQLSHCYNTTTPVVVSITAISFPISPEPFSAPASTNELGAFCVASWLTSRGHGFLVRARPLGARVPGFLICKQSHVERGAWLITYANEEAKRHQRRRWLVGRMWSHALTPHWIMRGSLWQGGMPNKIFIQNIERKEEGRTEQDRAGTLYMLKITQGTVIVNW